MIINVNELKESEAEAEVLIEDEILDKTTKKKGMKVEMKLGTIRVKSKRIDLANAKECF